MRLSIRKLAQVTVFALCLIYFNFVYWSLFELLEVDTLSSTQSSNGVHVPKDVEKLRVDAQSFGSNSNSRPFFDKLNRIPRAINTSSNKLKLLENGVLPNVKEKVTPVVRNDNTFSANTAWETSRMTELADIFISVKTTRNNHESRVQLLLETWVSMAETQTYFFTDHTDEKLEKLAPRGHVINTNCTNTHSRQALCCKMAVEFDFFMESRKRWFCHVDDDNYINIFRLVQLLRDYNHTDDWYIGRPSLKHPIEVLDRKNPPQKIAFWFATGGAGFCISRGLALKMMPYASGGRLMTVGESIRLPDDCTIGYIVDHILHKPLTVIENFHSHLESLWLIKNKNLKDEVTLSYAISSKSNIVDVSGFSEDDDPTRFWSVHCQIYKSYSDKCYEFRS